MAIYKGSIDMKNRVSNAGGVTFDQIFKAIGDPHRLQILMLLLENEMSAGEILKALDIVQSTLSHHMNTGVKAAAVESRKAVKPAKEKTAKDEPSVSEERDEKKKSKKGKKGKKNKK